MHMKASIPAFTRNLALVAIAALVTACGGKDEKSAATTEKAPTEDRPAAVSDAKPAAAESVAEAAAAAAAAERDLRLANAVVTSKTTAPVDLKYDVLVKPDVGKPFEVNLVFMPRAPADTLQVEVTGMEGLTVVSGGALAFDDVAAGERYEGKVLVQANESGLYYIGLAAKMISKVQTEVRAFSVPVVVGTVPAAVQKPAPATDAAGQPIESMPAVETGGPVEAPKQ